MCIERVPGFNCVFFLNFLPDNHWLPWYLSSGAHETHTAGKESQVRMEQNKASHPQAGLHLTL